MNKKIVVFIIGVVWVAVAAGMILSKQYTLRTGKTILLETVPLDPRDLLRGDYVVLRYKISTLELSQITSDKKHYSPGEVVYVRLIPKEKYWEAAAVQTKKCTQEEGLCIKGKVDYYYNYKLNLKYGIESYFVPEGEGKEIEKNMRGQKSSVSVEAMVDSSGNTLIKKVYIDK